MASEVTKRINGRDYRYVVDSYRDPETNRRKQRWRYVGVVDNGKLHATDRKPRTRITREEIVAATARLLEFRAPKHITVSVIAASADASRSAFYRHFPSAKEVIVEAMLQTAKEAVRALPPLRPPCNLEDARRQLHAWCKAFHYSVGFDRVCKRAVLQGYRGTVRPRLDEALTTEVPPAVRLSAFFKKLNGTGLAAIEDPEGLAEAIKGLHAALRLSTFAVLPGEEPPVPEYDQLYRLIERAVFGGLHADEITMPTISDQFK